MDLSCCAGFGRIRFPADCFTGGREELFWCALAWRSALTHSRNFLFLFLLSNGGFFSIEQMHLSK